MTDVEQVYRTLEPCPFCGGEAWLYSGEGRNYDWHGVKCEGLGANICTVFPDTTLLLTKAHAITAWNTRHRTASTAALTAERDALVALLNDALNLAVRARKLDDTSGSCGTVQAWVADQYDTDLAAWETAARKALHDPT